MATVNLSALVLGGANHWAKDREIMIHCHDLDSKSEVSNLTRPRGGWPICPRRGLKLV